MVYLYSTVIFYVITLVLSSELQYLVENMLSSLVFQAITPKRLLTSITSVSRNFLKMQSFNKSTF
jgi:hypothetical protein